MNFLHKREYLSAGNTVVVNCSHQCNIMLMNDMNFSRYKNRQGFNYHGGFFKMFPASLTAPNTNYWNIVLDLGGGSATIRHSIQIIK